MRRWRARTLVQRTHQSPPSQRHTLTRQGFRPRQTVRSVAAARKLTGGLIGKQGEIARRQKTHSDFLAWCALNSHKESGMRYRDFGRTEWVVSEVGYGMWGIGDL